MTATNPQAGGKETAALGPVLVVEDDPRMRERLRRILGDAGVAADDMAFAGDLAQARAALAAQAFGLVLVDIVLPDGSGVDLVAHLFEKHPQLPSVVVSAFGAEEVILSALRSGAVGYLLKEREDLEIALSLRSIARGGAPIDPFIAKRILALVAKATPAAAPTPSAPMPIEVLPETQLSQREQEVLRMVAQGLSNREIANAMSLSHLTVESHTKNIYRKLAVGSRTEAVYRARNLGWLQ